MAMDRRLHERGHRGLEDGAVGELIEECRLDDRTFERFQELIYREAGISLGPSKKALVVARLSKRLRALGLATFRDYIDLAKAQPDECVHLFDLITTNETRFFREPPQFDFLESHVFPDWEAQAHSGIRAHHVRSWSAGCSSGEEPYSLAMALLARLPPAAGWTHEIVATDLSTRALERAQRGVYPLERASEIPMRHRKAFMLRGTRAKRGLMKIGPELRRIVAFARLNLHADQLAHLGAFDLILCRNVLIYFDGGSKARAFDRLLERLSPEGYLLLGHAESPAGQTDRLRGVGPMAYKLRR